MQLSLSRLGQLTPLQAWRSAAGLELFDGIKRWRAAQALTPRSRAPGPGNKALTPGNPVPTLGRRAPTPADKLTRPIRSRSLARRLRVAAYSLRRSGSRCCPLRRRQTLKAHAGWPPR
jgi:hypothetical protein